MTDSELLNHNPTYWDGLIVCKPDLDCIIVLLIFGTIFIIRRVIDV